MVIELTQSFDDLSIPLYPADEYDIPRLPRQKSCANASSSETAGLSQSACAKRPHQAKDHVEEEGRRQHQDGQVHLGSKDVPARALEQAVVAQQNGAFTITAVDSNEEGPKEVRARRAVITGAEPSSAGAVDGNDLLSSVHIWSQNPVD